MALFRESQVPKLEPLKFLVPELGRKHEAASLSVSHNLAMEADYCMGVVGIDGHSFSSNFELGLGTDRRPLLLILAGID